MEDGQPKDSYPFKSQPGEEIARGWSESKVLEHDPGWIVKVTYRGWRNTEKQLAENKSDYEFFKSRLGDNIPETQFVRGNDEKGRHVNIVRQRKITGQTLAEYSKKLLENNPEAQKNLVELFKKIIKMWEEDGRIPDLVGPKNPQRSLLGNFIFGAYPWNTPNILIEDGTNKVFLVDTSASKRFQSKSAPLIYRKLSENIVRNMMIFVEKHDAKT